MLNLRWNKEEHNFPEIIGVGSEPIWYITYGPVTIRTNKHFYAAFENTFLNLSNMLNQIKVNAGDITPPYWAEGRDDNGDITWTEPNWQNLL